MDKNTILNNLQNFCFFAKPSFKKGMERVLDIVATMQSYNELLSPTQSDIEAITRDWQMVGKDIKESILIYEQQSTNI